MLAGQNFRWGQHGALPAILRSKPDGRSGHQRFAAAHIALQQTVHRGLPAQIMADFFRRAALCPGGCIGQAAPERRKVQLPHGGTGNFAAMASHQKDPQLQDIQFFKDQTAAGSGSICRVPRGMDGPHSVRFGRHAVAGQQLWRQRVIQLGHIFQRQLGTAGQAGGGQPFGAAVNRQQGRRSNLGFGAHKRVQDFPPGHHAANAALEIIFGSRFQLFRRIGRVEPGKRQHPCIVPRQHMGEHPPTFNAAVRVPLQHRCLYAAVHIKRGRYHGVWLRVVNIPPRIVQQQIPDGINAKFGKLFGVSGANALQVLDVSVDIRHGCASLR